MDAITHLLVGRLLALPLEGPLAILATAFAVLPDVDTVSWFAPRLRRYVRHRTWTHSLAFGVGASLAAATLFALAGWSGFGLAFAVALAGFLSHVALDVLHWGCLLLWPFRRDRVEFTVQAGMRWSAMLSLAALAALEGARLLAPALAAPLGAALAAGVVAYLALRLGMRLRAGRLHRGRRLVPTANPFVWLVAK